MGNALKVVDRGFNRLKRQMAVPHNRIKVGLQSDLGGELVLVGTWNEFGTATVPQRSFIRATIDEHRAELKAYAAKLHAQYIDKGGDIEKFLGLLGEFTQNLIKKKIQSNVPPPNAPATIERKGSSHTLIDTGRMVQSIRWVIEEKGGGHG